VLVLGSELGSEPSDVHVDRPGASVEVVAPDAVQELLAGAGTQFDPEVAYALLDAVAAGEHVEPIELPRAVISD